MSDLFLTLAQTGKRLSCFVATGWLPDGSRNRLKLQRLKDKCGNRSNASSEVEFQELHATMLGEEGHGIRTFIGMAHLTRLDFAIGSAGLMRQALSQAISQVSNRHAFQRSLVDQPIMRNVTADLAVEAEALMWLGLRLAHALDRSSASEAERLLARIATPVAKYWACKRAPPFVAEALEASLLLRHSLPAVADAFCATRLGGDWGRAFGTMPAGLDERAIVERMRIDV